MNAVSPSTDAAIQMLSRQADQNPSVSIGLLKGALKDQKDLIAKLIDSAVPPSTSSQVNIRA